MKDGIDPKTFPIGIVNQCMMCRHLVEEGDDFTDDEPAGWKCRAFGDADIPSRIVRGRFDHREPWPGEPSDNGILFEDKPGDRLYTWEDMMGPVHNNGPIPLPEWTGLRYS